MKTTFSGLLMAFLLVFSLALTGQTPGLVSGNLNITSFPTNNGDGTFTVTGTFNDPKGLYFPTDIDTAMILWKDNDFYIIDNLVDVSANPVTFRVVDVNGTGFIPTGNGQILERTANLNLPGASATGDSNAALATPPDHSALLNYLIRLLDQNIFIPDVTGFNITFTSGDTTINYSGGAGLLQYEATGVNGSVDENCYVTTTTAGATFERAGGSGQNTEGTLTVPSGSILQGLAVHFTAAQAPGNTYFLNIDYLDTGKAVNGSENSVMPVYATVATKPSGFTDVAPATNYVHSGTPIQVGVAQVDDNGTRTRVRIKITNYNQQAGANASILSVILP